MTYEIQTKAPEVVKKSLVTYEGRVDYLQISEENPAGNPLVVVPGFTQGVEVLEDFGVDLSRLGHRDVYVLDQLQRHQRDLEPPKPLTRDNRLGLEQQAGVLLEFLKFKDLTDKPVDFVTDSFGALATVRAAEIATTTLGWTCFKADKGSHMVLISPAGSKKGEFILPLGARFGYWLMEYSRIRKHLDPDGIMMQEGIQNSKDDPAKWINEVRALAKVRIPYERLGKIGIKPSVLAYPGDQLMPYRIMGRTLESNLDQLSGVSMVWGPDEVPAGNFKTFKKKTGLTDEAAKEAWAHHYRRADHSDMQFHPERTAKAVLQMLEAPTH